MLPWLLLSIIVCGVSVLGWIWLVLWKGTDFILKIGRWNFPCFEEVGPGSQPGLRPHGRMMNATHAGAYGSLCVFAGLGLALLWHPAFLVGAAMGLYIVWRTKTTGAAISLAFGSAGWLIAFPGHWAFILPPAMLSLWIACRYKLFNSDARKNLSSWRFPVWRDSIDHCLGNPFKDWTSVRSWLLGVGPNGWFITTRTHLQRYGGQEWLSPHNEFVHILCEHGLIGLLGGGVVMAWILGPSISLGGPESAAYLGVAGALIGVAMFSFPWRGTTLTPRPTGQMAKVGQVKTENGKDQDLLQPLIRYESAGAPAITWISIFWALLGPHMGG